MGRGDARRVLRRAAVSCAFDVGRCNGGDAWAWADGFGVRRASRLGCEGEGVDPVTIWGGGRRMHRADDERVRARHKWRVRARGVRQGASGLQAQRRCHKVQIA